MITIEKLQEYITEDPNRLTMFSTKISPKYYYTVEEVVDEFYEEEIIIRVRASNGTQELGLVSKPDFLSWIRDQKIKQITDE